MKAAEALVQILEYEGIQDVFGIPGAGINPVYKYLADAPMKHYCMRHEEACTHAADGYYRACRKIALAICTSGPGATNFVTGLYTASIDSIPFLAITGQANTWQMTQEPFQCVPIAEIAKPVAKRTYCVTDAGTLPQVLREAFYLMRSGRPGPVLIDLPLDVQMAEIDFNIADYQSLPIEKPQPDARKIAQAAQMLAEAKKPIIIMGGGITFSGCEKELVALADRLNIPVVTTYMAKGGIPEDHRLNVGHVGIQVGQPFANRVFLDSDLVLGVGCRFSDRHTGRLDVYRGSRKFIHIDIEPTQIGRVFQPDLGIVSDAAAAIQALEAATVAMKPFAEARIEEMAGWKQPMARKTDYEGSPIMPHRVFEEVNKAFAEDTLFCEGCGITQIWSGQLQKVSKPCQYLPAGGAGTLGYEVPAVFGAKVARPDQYAVTVVGDFGFTFLGEEIAVAAVNEKPIIAVILNNAYLGLIRQNQKGAYGFEYAVDMPYNQDGRIDYVKVAQGFGCEAERVFTPDELARALGRAKEASKAGKSYVIDVICVKEQLCDMGGSIDALKSFVQ